MENRRYELFNNSISTPTVPTGTFKTIIRESKSTVNAAINQGAEEKKRKAAYCRLLRCLPAVISNIASICYKDPYILT